LDLSFLEKSEFVSPMKFPVQKLSLNKLTLKRSLFILAGVIGVGMLALYLAATAFPSIGANGADSLRAVIGDKAVAQLESWIFQAQDTLHQIKYSLGLEKAAAPWQDPGGVPADQAPTATVVPSATATPAPTATPLPQATLEPTATPAPTLTPTPTPWRPTIARPLGSLEDEGIWQPYIKDAKGRVVAFRTFIQPDPKRPYAVVAVVAFDLSRTRLNFVLGWEEPSTKDGPKGTGLIPSSDALPGVLLATFNGGFKGQHGNYGAMSNGVVALQPKKGLATVVMYKDGSVQIGEYGKEITSLENAVAWRQNCSLIIDNEQINPLVNNNSAEYWGANLNGETVTWRSGIGISPDGKTFYYFAGPNMMMPILAAAMQAVDVKSGLQLDINNYWVHFTAIRDQAGKITPDPLFPDDMKVDAGRYLQKYPRDFFYVALKEEQ
jgi:hypothetical protein